MVAAAGMPSGHPKGRDGEKKDFQAQVKTEVKMENLEGSKVGAKFEQENVANTQYTENT